MKTITTKFKIGQPVKYVLAESVLFIAVITGIDTNVKNKPYILKDSDGKTRYANEIYLQSY